MHLLALPALDQSSFPVWNFTCMTARSSIFLFNVVLNWIFLPCTIVRIYGEKVQSYRDEVKVSSNVFILAFMKCIDLHLQTCAIHPISLLLCIQCTSRKVLQ